MASTFDHAKRYRERADEYLEIASTSGTPGTGETYLLLAQHYLLLATIEKQKGSGQCGAMG